MSFLQQILLQITICLGAPAQPTGLACDTNHTIAQIANYRISYDEFKIRYNQDVIPNPEFPQASLNLSPRNVLLGLIAEKAMLIEAQNNNLDKDPNLVDWLEEFKYNQMIELLTEKIINSNKAMNSDRIDSHQTTSIINDSDKQKLVTAFCDTLYITKRVTFEKKNYPAVRDIYQRLLKQVPRDSEPIIFIRAFQVKQQITEEEKNTALACYDGGTVTIRDWFKTLTDFSPPSRPDVLDDFQIERILKESIKYSLLINQAVSEGIDKHPEVLKSLKAEKEGSLIGMIAQKNISHANPSPEQIRAFFDSHPELFNVPSSCKVWRIWFNSFQKAQAFLKELNAHSDKNKFISDSKFPKQSCVTSINDQGLFYEQLLNIDTNKPVGPLAGIYKNRCCWQIVKLIEKLPEQKTNFDPALSDMVKYKMIAFNMHKEHADCKTRLLKKYQFDIDEQLLTKLVLQDLFIPHN